MAARGQDRIRTLAFQDYIVLRLDAPRIIAAVLDDAVFDHRPFADRRVKNAVPRGR